MTNHKQCRKPCFGPSFGRRAAALLIGFMLASVAMQQAQTYQVIHAFTGVEGQSPYAGLTMDAAGRLYGTTFVGGTSGFGTVFKLTPSGSGWVLTSLYNFAGSKDGACPWSRVIFGPDGALYGTTTEEAAGCLGGKGFGTVFSLRPPMTACKTALCPWTETTLYAFGGNDGSIPTRDLTFDGAGNIYGTTRNGGPDGVGTVYQLTPTGGGWTENTLYTFDSQQTLYQPSGGVTFDQAGNLYGTAEGGSYGGVFELTPSAGGWAYNDVYTLHGGAEGANPLAGLIFDAAGNLYGATTFEGSGGGGTVFELMPLNGGWAFTTLYSFAGVCCDFVGPWASLVMDAQGSLYGTTNEGGAFGYGTVFKLTPGATGWSYVPLHDFTGRDDGAYPKSNVVFDAGGNLYGTAANGGRNDLCSGGCGVVWEITP
jgi:uncharacterized repeat protein (TIGR03803 family)